MQHISPYQEYERAHLSTP